ncbi:MAG: hypothetical protein KKD38_01185 [Candidatus Delongbacteria bacterium]|nr:hypothetical protein [Candidatus Delongbacteria bacterium]MCG2760398.1 hypothetical protein [Candidatus Delongbacteria bacterium]
MKTVLFFIFLLIFGSGLSSQTLLKINSADLLKQNPFGGKIIYGNVDIEYDIYRVKCDSAVINKDMTNARLYRNIQFSDTSRTIRCNSATLSKTPNGKLAFLTGNIRLTEKDFFITGKEAVMNEINNKVTVSDSVVAKYYKFPSILFCSELEYDIKNNIIGSGSVDSVLYIDSLRFYKLFTRYFSYSLESKSLSFNNKFELESHEFATPLDFYNQIDPARISQIVKKYDIIKDSFFSANKGNFNFNILEMETIGKCSFYQIDRIKQDTVFFSSDKILYSDAKQIGVAEGNVKIKKDKLNIISELAKYYYEDQRIKFLQKPVIKYENHEITGDSIRLLVEDSDFYPKEADIYGDPFYKSVPDENFPNEINILKGKLMNIRFLNKEISKIIVSKEAKGLYFIRGDKNKNSEASNYLLGDKIGISFKDGDIDSASIEGGCEGIYYPDKLKQNALKEMKK